MILGCISPRYDFVFTGISRILTWIRARRNPGIASIGAKLMKRYGYFWVLVFGLALSSLSQTYPLKICSFNIQFLGQSKVRDDVALANLIKDYDVVVVQELIAPPYPGTFPDGTPFQPDPEG